jgi:hypothetical protein
MEVINVSGKKPGTTYKSALRRQKLVRLRTVRYTNIVAVGGFLVEESFLSELQGAEISAQSCSPEDVFSEGELQYASQLASVHGLEPWVHARWYAWQDVGQNHSSEPSSHAAGLGGAAR